MKHWLAKGPAMPVTQATPFHCPTCSAEYKLVRVETKQLVPDRQIFGARSKLPHAALQSTLPCMRELKRIPIILKHSLHA